jgi:hypothetical protein
MKHTHTQKRFPRHWSSINATDEQYEKSHNSVARMSSGELLSAINLLLILFIITSPYEEYNCVLIVLKAKGTDAVTGALRQQILHAWAHGNENPICGSCHQMRN